jgi:Spy/CpxP family protein refolding chaperone
MKKIIPLMLIAFLFFAGQTINAQTTDESADAKASISKHDCKGQGCMKGIPDLTDQQKQKIEELCLATKKEMNGIKNLMGEKQAHLKTLQDADKADMVAINKTIDEISVLKADMMKKHEATRQTVRGLLTDKQKTIFDSNPKGCCAGGEGEEKCGKHGNQGKGGSCCPGGGQGSGDHKCGGQNGGEHKCSGGK